jgi:hypothetical protein
MELYNGKNDMVGAARISHRDNHSHLNDNHVDLPQMWHALFHKGINVKRNELQLIDVQVKYMLTRYTLITGVVFSYATP